MPGTCTTVLLLYVYGQTCAITSCHDLAIWPPRILHSAMQVLARPILGCKPPVNAAELAGAVAVVVRGGCSFTHKILRVQSAGAGAAAAAAGQQQALTGST
jgi:hypothetical protein